MNSCLICKKAKSNNSEDILLSNNSFVHKDCEEILYTSIEKTKDQKELQRSKNLLKSIYDYWPSYPPDWTERKEKIKSEGNLCSRCGKTKTRKYRKYPLEVHHTISISNGGSHLESNLELICKSCHKKEHEKYPYKFRKKKKGAKPN